MRGMTKSEDMKMKINKQNMTFREASSKSGGGLKSIKPEIIVIKKVLLYLFVATLSVGGRSV